MAELRMSRRVMNLATLLRQAARRVPDGVGLVWGERSWRWAEIEARAGAIATGLIGMGLGKGDRVLVHSKNCEQMFAAQFAVFRIGAVWVPTNFRLLADEVVDLARMAKVSAFLCHPDFPGHAAAVADVVQRVVMLGAEMEALIAAHAGAPCTTAAVEYDDPCWFFFTSGTTGRSKASVLTHGQMAFVVNNHLADLLPGTNERDASLVVAPLSHGAGVHQLTQVARAAKTVLLPTDRFDVAEAWRLIAEHLVTNLFTVPTILKLLAEHPDAAPHALRHVIYAGAPMYRADQRMILQRLGKVIVQYFGLGEVTGNITYLRPDQHEAEDGPAARMGTCGFERTGMEVQIQDEAGRVLPPCETGEICVIGPAVFAGYFDNPEANAKAFRDGWFRTGDLGHMDAEGFLYITGRASDMYISGGSNIHPREVEEKLLTHPDVAECAVLGVPDALWGEVGVAAVVPRGAGDEAALLAWMGEKMPRYKIPKRVFFLDEMPKSGYGKVPKRLVRDALEARGLLPLAKA
ncbi:acyl-CoA synthetase [Plastoroseomonas arctica]|uniref:AMP-binding protein n=1 Tax=Plastoroseomonas arctica TaxID=1509237 RepID=A0AAF1K6B2_9PROT|nr:acyl-CoA synthetase [Plastoroseomonas arctica]MBR0657144.1 AMP-binding protein [Plastoroseomonas arctica]